MKAMIAFWLLVPAMLFAQDHPSQLPELSNESSFPRCTESDLVAAGFPDHKHAHHWAGWVTPETAEGEKFGPGSLCMRKELLGSDELIMEPGVKYYRQFRMMHNPGYSDCDMLAFVELVDWANHVVPELLGLSTSDTLTILNPDNTEHYKEQARQGIWRLYRLEGNEVTIEPYPVLLARTLDGHAAFMLITDWILNQALPQELPPWLHHGLVEYIGEDGAHLFNYMAEFKAAGPVLFSAPLVDAILGAGVDPDKDKDREMFRRASYSAFLMVWQLVEHEGGLESLQEFLAKVASGADLDDASQEVYGVPLNQLASLVDAVANGEPAGEKMSRQRPHQQPN